MRVLTCHFTYRFGRNRLLFCSFTFSTMNLKQLKKFAPPLLVVMVALMAPWPPAQMTLTTAGLAWRLQCLTWGMMMMRTSMTRMTMKTKLSTPRHSNKHSPSNHPHRGNLNPFFVCASSTFSPVSHACISVWLSQGCR